MKILPRRGASLLLGASLALGTAAPALAEHEAPRLGLTPIGENGQFFELTLEPGESGELQLELASFGHDDVRARTYAADAYSIINGGFGADLFGEPASGATAWLDFPSQELSLGSRAAVVIDFSMTVPDGTPPGEYIAAVVAENVDPYRDESGSVALDQVNRVALAIAVNVPGSRDPAIEVGAVGHKVASGSSFVNFEVENTGNVHLKPNGEFTLFDSDGSALASAPAVMDSVYAGSATLFEAPLAEALTPGDYCAALSLTDEQTGTADATECLAFTVQHAVAATDGTGDGPQTIPILQPAIDTAIGNVLPTVLNALAVLVPLGTAWLLWRTRRKGSRSSMAPRERRAR